MNRTKYYSGMIPSVEDLEFEQTSKETAIKKRVADFFSDGVLTGLKVSIESEGVFIQPGVAYTGGERILVTQAALVSSSIQNGYVFIRFVQNESEPESHFITGTAHNTRINDGFISGIQTTDVLEENALMLAQIESGFAIDKRTFIELKLSKPESIQSPSNLVVNTGFETEVSYNSSLAS